MAVITSPVMNAIRLADVTSDNWWEVAYLRVHPTQERFVMPAVYSIAEAQFYPLLRLQAVVAAEDVVGMALYGRDDEDEREGRYWLFRMLIDVSHQGKGYGRAAAGAVLAEMAAEPECREIWLRYAWNNEAAAKLYRELGFEVVGEEHGQVTARLTLTR